MIGNNLEILSPDRRRLISLDVRRVRRISDNDTPAAIARLAELPGVLRLHWKE